MQVSARDARFSHALELARQGKTDAAIQLFGALAHDYPKLPEPANNLAVLYAQQGKYDKARRWLEAALATRPAYAIAYKNLSNVYTALAAMAYSKALNQQNQPPDLDVRLKLLSTIHTSPPVMVAGNASRNDEQSQSAEAANAAQTATTTAVAETPSISQTRAGVHVVEAPQPIPEPAHVTSSAQTQSASTGQADATIVNRVKATVHAWAKAWSTQNVAGYLDAYASSFQPGHGRSLAQWRALRTERVGTPQFIHVSLANLQVRMLDKDRAVARFVQSYASDGYSDKVKKTLVLVFRNGDWRIVKETSKPL